METHPNRRQATTPEEAAIIERIEDARWKKTPVYTPTSSTTTNEFLDEIKERYAPMSDYKLAEFLGLGQTTISSYRMGKSKLHDSVCLKVAAKLDADPRYVLSCIAEERARAQKELELARYWHSIARVIKAGAPLIVVASALAFTAAWFDYSDIGTLLPHASSSENLHIM